MAEFFDVVVAGYGYAGAVAAIEAHDAGARVLLIEKADEPGGISVCSAGGLRISRDADAAFAYLVATNAGTTPEPVLRVLADGMFWLPDYARRLTEAVGGALGLRDSPANYPLPGYKSFGFAYVDDLPGFEPATAFPNVRGAAAGARLFAVLEENVRRRPGITVRLACPAERLLVEGEAVAGLVAGGQEIRAGAVVLATGGFEAAEEMKLRTWPLKPVLSAAVRGNTGDGIALAQKAGAGLWHMWHFHGSYGFRHPDPDYPFGIRLKRLPDWVPGEGVREDVRMSWILVDREGRRFGNEYEPYMQDTGHRAMEAFDPVTQSFSRVPALLIVDAAGRVIYPLAAPTWHDAEVAQRFGGATPASLDEIILRRFDSIVDLAHAFGRDPAVLQATVDDWNLACISGADKTFGRPSSSMMPIASPPFSAAEIWPIVSNTQGGPVHDGEQRVLDPFGAPIQNLFAAGELGSVFGHLYMSGGNIAECFVGGAIAGKGAARAAIGVPERRRSAAG